MDLISHLKSDKLVQIAEIKSHQVKNAERIFFKDKKAFKLDSSYSSVRDYVVYNLKREKGSYQNAQK